MVNFITTALKRILKIVKLQSLVAKCCKMQKIKACKVCKFCILLHYARKTDNLFSIAKNTIYLINCLHYHLVYVRETGRTVRSRIKEHLRMDKQTVHVHLRTHNIEPQSELTISRKILHSKCIYWSNKGS